MSLLYLILGSMILEVANNGLITNANHCAWWDFYTGNGTAAAAAASSTVMSFSSDGPLGPVKPTISGPISINAAGRQATPFRFW